MFLNSGIRAKVFMRQIGFKLCDEIESHRIVLCILAIFSQRMQRGGGVASHGQPLCRADQPRPTLIQSQPPTASPQGAATCRGGTCGHAMLPPARRVDSRWQCGARKGLPPTASPTASKGDDAGRRGGHPLVGRLPVGKGSDDGTEGARGKLGFPFVKRTILPL
ncbi:hypothetical protein BHE74_00039191 [Ensete ventricosum]|nr:hypothetical protein GW17_00043405 [Ensete ventricosum]RWW54237.1 hypothetical protein BHE74_00039191 [Ensete ventricosum]